MLIKRAPEYDNVVEICEAGIVQHSAKDDCHQAHEGSGCRRESKRHNCVLKQKERRTERGFLPVIRMQFDLMGSHCQVERREKL